MQDSPVEWRNFGVPMVVRARPLTPPSLPGLLIVAAIGFAIAMMLVCCLLSMRIGAERARVEALDARIAVAQQRVATLRKEEAIRSRYEELDRWNAALGLTAPKVDQYLAGDAALAAYSPRQPRLALTRDRMPAI